MSAKNVPKHGTVPKHGPPLKQDTAAKRENPTTPSWLRPWMFVALVILLVSCVRIRLLETPLERDEGEYAYAGQLILHGIPPYQLAYNMKFPGTYAAYAGIMAIFGQTISGIHLGFLFLNAATIFLVYLLGKRLVSSTTGVASAAAYALLSLGAGVYGTQAHATHFVVAAALGGMLVLLRALASPRSSTLFWSGMLFGIAVLMKQHAVLFVAFGVVYLVWEHGSNRRTEGLSLVRKLTGFLGGVLTPLAVTGLLLWRAQVFSKFWFWTISYAREYALEQSFSGGIAAFRSAVPTVVGPNAAIWIVALAGILSIWWRRDNRGTAAFLTALLLFSFLAVCPGLYFREHYFVLLLPVVALLAGTAVAALERWSRSPSLTYGVFCAVLLVSVLQQQDFLFRMTPFEVSRAMCGTNPFPEAVQVAKFIRDHSAKSARVAVLGSEPEILFYADRLPATGYIYTYGLMENQPFALPMQNEFIRDVEASRPEYLVLVDVASSWLERPDSPKRLMEWWGSTGIQSYKPVGVADIISPDHTEYRWENVETYNSRPHPAIWIYKRKAA